MKTLLLISALCFGAMAQDFHGVSIGGTLEAPTIVNNSGKALLAYSVERITSNGVNHWFDVLNFGAISAGKVLQPGETSAALGIASGFIKSEMRFKKPGDRSTMEIVSEGDPVGYKVHAVVFSDGSHYGWGLEFYSQQFYVARSLARDLQYGLAEDRKSSLEHESIGTHGARSEMATAILSAGDREAAIARVAALPDVVKGE